MLGLRHGHPEAGLEVKSCGFPIRIFNVRIRYLLQIPQPKHVDVGLKQAAIWYRARDLLEAQRLLGEVELQEAILIWGPSLKWPPNDVETLSYPGSLQTFKEAEWGVGRTG